MEADQVKIMFLGLSALLALLYLFCQLRFLLLPLLDLLFPGTPRRSNQLSSWPEVTIQLPVYREQMVISHLLQSVVAIEAPPNVVRIHVLDDSTGSDARLTEGIVATFQSNGTPIQYFNRESRAGFKAGVLNFGLTLTDTPLVAYFDADCTPTRSFLASTVPYFSDAAVAAVQVRWEYPNAAYSPLTQVQAAVFEWLFEREIAPRAKWQMPVYYMGTAAVWRTKAIQELGGWQEDPITCEDLDLSYRAALHGWKVLYHPDVLASNRAVEDVLAFRAQQRRWARSLLQVGYDNFCGITQADWSFSTKLLELSMLLTHSLPVVLLAAVLASSFAVIFRTERTTLWFVSQYLLTAAFLFSPALLVFIQVQRSLHPDWPARAWALIRSLPATMDMAICFIFGFLDFIGQQPGEFSSTPKGGVEGLLGDSNKKWVSLHVRPIIFEGLIAVLLLTAATTAVFRYPEACVTIGVVGVATLLSFARAFFSLQRARRHRSSER